MKIDWITIRVIWQMVSGFIIAVLSIFILAILASVIFAEKSKLITENINSQYYFTQQTCGFPNLETIEEIRVYRTREWLPDKRIANIDMYAYGIQDINVKLSGSKMTLYVNSEVKLDTIIDPTKVLQINVDDW